MLLPSSMDNQSLRENLLSKFLSEVKQAFQGRQQSNFWFNSLQSFSFPSSNAKIKNDLSKTQYHQLLRMLNYLISDFLGFYKKNPPQQIYKLLSIVKSVFGLNYYSNDFEAPGLQQFQGFSLLMSQIYFNNILALFLSKHRQYSHAFQCYQFILQAVKKQKVNIYQDAILASLSNYLALVCVHQLSYAGNKIKQLIECIHNIFQGLLNKYLKSGCQLQNLITMVTIYKQNQKNLQNRFKAQMKLLVKKHEQANRTKQNSTVSQQSKMEKYFHENKGKRVCLIQVKIKQISFLTLPMISQRISIQKGFSSQLSRYEQYNNILSANSQFLTITPRTHTNSRMQKLRMNVEFASVNRTIDYDNVGRTAQRQKVQTPKKVEPAKVEQKKQKRKKIYLKNEPVTLKTSYSIIQVMTDGIILSDVLRQRKRFLTWFQVNEILKNLRFSHLVQEFMPICSFYDIGYILSFYTYKAANDYIWGAAILDTPKEILELNIFTKFYKIEGPYLKAFIMNRYDANHLELSIDCYLSQFEQVFKRITINQYIQKLNRKILKEFHDEVSICCLQFWKRKKDTILLEMANQFHAEQLVDVSFLKSSLFKIMLLMPNSKQILVCLKQKQMKQESDKKSATIPLTVIDMKCQDNKQNKLNVPLYKVARFFPMPEQTGQWMKKYGKYLIQGYFNCFQNFPQSFNNFQNFNVITYAKKIEMIDQGKYKVPLIAQMIGSKQRIWGISIRHLQQYQTRQSVTFILNPYYQLLSPAIKLSPEDRKKILIQNLLQGSVNATFQKLKQHGLKQKMVNLIHYWNIIQF